MQRDRVLRLARKDLAVDALGPIRAPGLQLGRSALDQGLQLRFGHALNPCP
ncbi:MAG: hypothetical protein M5U08_10040 [Burkholderiales bacterium]|nr:hypothetical protein [Burkholderiales bacterium]